MKDLVTKGAEHFGIYIDETTAEKFDLYYKSVVSYNEKVNLTAITDETEFCVKHFLDSIAAAKFLSENAKLVDVGSGAGFPAVPLKLIRGDLSVTMIDALGKRVTFLNSVTEELGLKDIRAIHLRAEDAAKGELRESFDVVTARAVSELRTLAEYCLPLVKIGGRFVSYKSANSDEEIKAAENAIKILGGTIEKIDDFWLPISGEKRRLVIIKKIAATPKKYPRGQGKEKKQPL